MKQKNAESNTLRSHFVRHAGDNTDFTLSQAFNCAFAGLGYAFTTQRNFRVHACFALLAIILGFVLSIPLSSWIAVVLCIAAVFSLEVLNTAVESIVDMVSPEWHELAMRAKDCAAGAVFLAAIASLVVAVLVYVPPLLAFIATMTVSM